MAFMNVCIFHCLGFDFFLFHFVYLSQFFTRYFDFPYSHFQLSSDICSVFLCFSFITFLFNDIKIKPRIAANTKMYCRTARITSETFFRKFIDRIIKNMGNRFCSGVNLFNTLVKQIKPKNNIFSYSSGSIFFPENSSSYCYA